MATDWAKLKVVDLKAELKRRGLPNLGRKEELVQRLRDNEEGTVEDNETGNDVGAKETAPLLAPEEPTAEDSVQPLGEQDVAAINNHSEVDGKLGPTANDAAVDAPLATNEDGPIPIETDLTQTPTPVSHAENDSNSNLRSLAPSEPTQDIQKRKRRSKSPSPSPDLIRKRARISDQSAAGDQDTLMSNSEYSAQTVASKNHQNHKPGVPTPTNPPFDTTTAVEKQVDEGDTLPNTTHNATFQAHPDPAQEQLQSEVPSAARSTHNHGKEEGDDDVNMADNGVEPAIHPPTPALYIKNFMRPLRAVEVEEHLIALATSNGRHRPDEVIVEFFLDQIRTHAFVEFQSTAIAVEVRASLHNKVWPEERNRKALWVDFLPADKVRAFKDQEELAETGRRNSTNRWDIVYDRIGDRIEVSLQSASPDSTRHTQPPRPTTVPATFNPTSAAHTDIRPGVPTGPSRQLSDLNGAPSGPKGFVHPSRLGQLPNANQQDPTMAPSRDSHASRPASFGQAHNNRSAPSDMAGRVTRAGPPLAYNEVPDELAYRRLDNLQTYISKNRPRDMGRESNRYTFESGASFVDRGKEVFEGIRPPHRERQKRDRERREREERERGPDRRGTGGAGGPASYRDSDRDRVGGTGRFERGGNSYRDDYRRDGADTYRGYENRDGYRGDYGQPPRRRGRGGYRDHQPFRGGR